MKTTEPPVIVKQAYNTSRYRVWSALTTLEEMVQWFFPNISTFEAKVGFETNFDVTSGERVFPHYWKILEIIEQQFMVQEWHYKGYPGLCTVAFELETNKEQTLLTVTATVLEDFSDDIPEFRRESCLGGWQYFIQERLKQHLNR